MASKYQKRYRIKKGDRVRVVAGADKGKEGEILAVFRKTDRVLVDGVRIMSRHTKPDAANPNGGIIKKEAPIHISNVMVLDPKTGEPTRIGVERDENGKAKRIAKKSGEEIK